MKTEILPMHTSHSIRKLCSTVEYLLVVSSGADPGGDASPPTFRLHPPNIWRRPSVQYCFETGLTFVNVKSLIEHKQCDFISGDLALLNTHIYCSPTLVTAQNAHLDRLNFPQTSEFAKTLFL